MSFTVTDYKFKDEGVNNIIFSCGNQEMIVLKENGDIYVKGNLVENDKEVIEGMKEFLNYHKTNRSEK
ncbi:hypothetical protein ABEY43_06095 [Priestia megaterium]